MSRKADALIDKINLAVRNGKGASLSLAELLELAQTLNEQCERAMGHEAMLHTFVQRAYGQQSLAIH